MLRSVTLMALMLFVPFAVLAQHVKKNKKHFRITPWTISDRFAASLTPSSFLDPYGALCPVGLSYYFGERYSISAEAGFPLYYVLNNYTGNPEKTINSDYKARIAIQQYFRLRERSRCFFGAEMGYRNQEMYLRDSYLRYINGESFHYSSVNATKSLYTLGAFVGMSCKLSERFMLDGHLGLGLRLLNMKTDLNTTGLTPFAGSGSFSSLVPPNEDRIGDRDINIYLPFAIKIVYLF